MKKSCSKCGGEFAHASSLSRHKQRGCGGGGTKLPCPYCSTTFGRADALKRHVDRYCKQRPTTARAISVQQVGTERAAEHSLDPSEEAKLHDIPKRRLVDYESSSDEEEEACGLASDLDRMEQLEGTLTPLFRFQLETIERHQKWHQSVDYHQFHTILHRLRSVGPRDNVTMALVDALCEAIRTQIVRMDNVNDRDRLHIYLQARVYIKCSVKLKVGDILRRTLHHIGDMYELVNKLKTYIDSRRGFRLNLLVLRMPPSNYYFGSADVRQSKAKTHLQGHGRSTPSLKGSMTHVLLPYKDR